MSASFYRPRERRHDGSSCPLLFSVDCGDGACCSDIDTCVAGPNGETLCQNNIFGTVAALTVSTASSTTSSPSSSSSSSFSSSRTTSSLSQTPTTTASSTQNPSQSSTPITPSPTTTPTDPTQAKSQSSVKQLQPAQVAGIAAGAAIGGIVLILLLISAIMWYCRRRAPKDTAASDSFNPATDSVTKPPNAVVVAARDAAAQQYGSSSSSRGSRTQMLDMNDPAAWRESYSAASPRELDGEEKVLSRHFSFNNGDDDGSISPLISPKGGGGRRGIDSTVSMVSPTTPTGFSPNFGKTETSSLRRYDDGRGSFAGVGVQQDSLPVVLLAPAPLKLKRKPVPQVAELPG